METLDFDYFFQLLKVGDYIDETRFYFSDDPNEDEHLAFAMSESLKKLILQR